MSVKQALVSEQDLVRALAVRSREMPFLNRNNFLTKGSLTSANARRIPLVI
jgi:hypothetical protein